MSVRITAFWRVWIQSWVQDFAARLADQADAALDELNAGQKKGPAERPKRVQPRSDFDDFNALAPFPLPSPARLCSASSRPPCGFLRLTLH
jgi:hypothetical protein